ncbi:Transcription factor [Moelleriella libera RCEF 2490]|uniref:Transcription factor n=1 Tax=Moelleriella libera RCEF 2490 TaxID=1081109 RepID=A0A166UTR4_9HYPO|nr:Transcription factor [Moelleriella libera RCEF 2490]
MPVLNETEIMEDVQRFDKLPLPRQVLILSLCACTRIQLKRDQKTEAEEEVPVNTYLHAPLTGRGILAAAKRLRRQFDIVDNVDLDAIVTSYFLFTAHGNLEEHRHALFLLNEAITMTFTLGLDNEETYASLPASEREMRRRIFWLLFVTERTYALQRRQPVMLRSTISKPQVIDSDCPVLMHDFVNHIRLFELLPPTLYDWRPSGDPLQQQVSAVALSQRVADMLCTVQAGDSMLESQQFDTLVTQQWLRVSMWRLAFGQVSKQLRWHSGSTNAKIPFDAGRSIMGHLEAVSSTNKDCHGISLVSVSRADLISMQLLTGHEQEQKLFDIGVSLSDASLITPPTSFFELGPVDLLYSIVKCLGHIRGCKSPLLPELLKHCGGLLPYSTPAPQLSMSSTLYESPVDSPCRLLMDGGETASTEEPSPDGSWHQDENRITDFEEIGHFINELSCEPPAFDECSSVG